MGRRLERRWSLKEATARLGKQQGELPRGPPSDPWSQILWENVAYLASDEARATAFRELEASVGMAPKAILDASRDQLRAIGARGILPETSVEKLRECARIAMDRFGGDPRALEAMPTEQLRPLVERFPGIGMPSRERILLYARLDPILALDSNGLRVLLRLGYGKKESNYARTYASVRRALPVSGTEDFDFLIEAHERLRTHGKSLCHRTHPHCSECPLAQRCPSREDLPIAPGARRKMVSPRKSYLKADPILMGAETWPS